MQLHGWLLPVLLLGAPPADAGEPVGPRLEKGLELVWRGTFQEEVIRPGVRTERSYDWEGRALVLDRSDAGARVVLLTTLRMRPGPEIKGPEPTPAVHIELAQVGVDGRVGLLPAAVVAEPAAAAEPTPVPAPALDALPLVETGMFVAVPGGRAEPGQTWDAAEPGRPFRAWAVEGIEPVRGARCFQVVGTQQTAGWTVPRGQEVAWRRVDTVWLSAANGYAARAERLVERRDPETQEITLRTRLAYEQVGRIRYPGVQFEDRRAEAAQALLSGARMEQLARDPTHAGPGAFEALLRRLAAHEAAHPVGEGIPYREAILAVRRRAEAARRGNLAPLPAEEPAEVRGRLTPQRPAPDFAAPLLNGRGDVRLYRLLGRPVVLFYYRPDAESAETILRFAERLHADPRRPVNVLAVAVGDEKAAREQALALGLTVPVLAGRDVAVLHGIESTPQAAVLDAEGAVRRVFVGWGPATGGLLLREAGGR